MTSKLRVTGLCVGNSSVTGEFATQRASTAENVCIWWRHHVAFETCSVDPPKLLDVRPCRYKPTVYPKKYEHGFCFAVLCCGYTLTDLPISIRLTSLALWQSNDCPSASKATLMNMDKYFMWIHYERLHNHNKAKHNKNRVHISWDILYITIIIDVFSLNRCCNVTRYPLVATTANLR